MIVIEKDEKNVKNVSATIWKMRKWRVHKYVYACVQKEWVVVVSEWVSVCRNKTNENMLALKRTNTNNITILSCLRG